MEILVKVGDKLHKNHADYLKQWRDGQVVDIRPDGYYGKKRISTSTVVIKTPHDFWALRKARDLKAVGVNVYALKKFLVTKDTTGKLPWELNYDGRPNIRRRRDWFIDFKYLLLQGVITLSQYENLYDFSKKSPPIFLASGFDTYIFHEDIKTRLVPFIKNMAVASGIYTIGAAGDYSDVAAFEVDLAATLTGNLTGEHLDEETSIGSLVSFNLDTATHLLKLTAQSGASHNGVFGSATHVAGDGARVATTNSDYIHIDGANTNNIEISDLVIDAAGWYNGGVRIDGGGATGVLLQRLVIKGDADSIFGIEHRTGDAVNMTFRNNIIYDFSSSAKYSACAGIIVDMTGSITLNVYNNTLIGNVKGFNNNYWGSGATLNLKNNLCQGNTADYTSSGSLWGTHSANVSEDATSPDGASYQSKDMHTTNDVFLGYSTDNFKLDSAGNATNLAILDDATAPGGFTDDIISQTRSTWYIGASEIVAGGGGGFQPAWANKVNTLMGGGLHV